jgi:hypothetical protein
MKIKELVEKYTKKDSKGSHSPKVDGKLLWQGKKVSGNRKMLKKELNLLKPKVSKQDGGDEIILTTKISYIVINVVNQFMGNCTLKLSTPKGLTLNQCLEKCNYLMKFIIINDYLWDGVQGTENFEDYLKKSKFKSYQVYRNYFIINV